MAIWFKRNTVSGLAAMIGSSVDSTHAFIVTPFTDGNVYGSFGANFGRFVNNDTSWHRMLISFDGTQSTNATRLQMYLDGLPQTLTFTGTIPSAIPALSQAFQIGRDVGNNRWSSGAFDDATVWLRPLSAREAFMDCELSRLGYPGALNRFRPTSSLFNAGANLGTGAVTLGALTVSGVGSFTDTATGAITLGPLAVTATGTFTDVGSGAITLGPLTVAGAGKFTDTGTGAIALGALVTSGIGTTSTVGSGAITLGALSPSGSGTFTVTASGSIALAGLGVSGTGLSGQFGTGAITLAPLIVSGTGTAAAGARNIVSFVDPRAAEFSNVQSQDAEPGQIDPRAAEIIWVSIDPRAASRSK